MKEVSKFPRISIGKVTEEKADNETYTYLKWLHCVGALTKKVRKLVRISNSTTKQNWCEVVVCRLDNSYNV